jgi:hypothetical protein
VVRTALKLEPNVRALAHPSVPCFGTVLSKSPPRGPLADELAGEPLPGTMGNFSFFVAQVDRIDGDLRWIQGFPTSALLDVEDVAVTKEGASVVLGDFDGLWELGTRTLSSQKSDVFLLSLSPEGDRPSWSPNATEPVPER